MKRYAGNEPKGYMLVRAFRILSNTTGLTLIPVGRQPRRRPHRDRPLRGGVQELPLRSVVRDRQVRASLLPTKKPASDPPTFTPATAGPQQLLGKTIADDKQLIETLVDSDAWRFNQCRSVFKFLYGRSENQCEAKVFDACVMRSPRRRPSSPPSPPWRRTPPSA